MAIYDTGTASLSASGQVTGAGTQWTRPLTLIRVGATIVFKTEPVKIYTISEITSDTSMSVYNPNSETVPAGTGYAILAHDGITVQGLAQDVAETLRYYQSRETEVAAAVDAFNNFDADAFQQNVTNVNNQSQQVANDAQQVSLHASDVASNAESAQLSASSAAQSAIDAANSASSIDTTSFLRKDGNLSGLSDITASISNLTLSGAKKNSQAFEYINDVTELYALESGKTYIAGESYSSSSTVIIPAYCNVIGSGMYTYRGNRNSFKEISKTSNSTYKFSNEDITTVQSRDCVIGFQPSWFDGRWPHAITLEKLSINGNPSKNNEAGIFIFQGQDFRLRDVSFRNCVNSLFLNDVWLSEFSNLRSLSGRFLSSRGTSQQWYGCWSSGTESAIGAFYFNDTTYTTMISCGSDGSKRTAYYFQGGSEVTMVSCGTEFPVNDIDDGLGSMVALNGNCRVNIVGFKGVPNSGQATPLISVGSGDTLIIKNWNSYQASYQNSIDISVNGNNSIVDITDSVFSGARTGNVNFPRVQFRGEQANSFVYLTIGNKKYVYKSPTGGGFVNSPEPMNYSASFTPELLVNNESTTELTYTSRTGYVTKTANSVTISFDITIGTKRSIASAATIKVGFGGVPSYLTPTSPFIGHLNVFGASSFDAGFCSVVSGQRYLFIGSTSNEELKGSNIASGTRIIGQITFNTSTNYF